MSLFSELKRRNVFHVTVLYIIAGWVILQAADLLVDILPVPEWAAPLVFMLLILGFPLVVIFSWIYEITPEGLKLEKEVDRDGSITHLTGKKIEYMIGVLAVLAIVVVVADRLVPETNLQSSQVSVEKAQLAGAADVARPENSIAVLAFVDLSEGGDQAYFSHGLSEELLNLLAKLPELKVASRTSSFSFADKSVDVPTMAAQLGVRYLLEGSVRRQNTKVRVTAQLIDALSNFHIWSETYDRDVVDVFAIQDDIASNVVSKLKLVLSDSSSVQLGNRPAPDFRAYEFYLKGRELLRRPVTMQTLENAESYFSQALQIDPQYVEASAGLCDTYLARYDRTSEVSYFERAELACHRALTLDRLAADVYVALGNLYRLSGQYQKAEQEYLRALKIRGSAVDGLDGLARTYEKQNKYREARETYVKAIEEQPFFWRGYQSLGNFLFRIGESGEAIQYFERAVELTSGDPRALNSLGTTLFMEGEVEKARTAWQKSLAVNATPIAYSNLGTANFFLGNFIGAAEFYKQGIALTPDDHQLWGALGDAYRYSDKNRGLARSAYEQAVSMAEAQRSVNPADATTLAMLAHYYTALGDKDRAGGLLKEAEALAPEDMYVHYYAALVASANGQTERALAHIEKTIQHGYPAKLLGKDAGFSALFSDKRFKYLTEAA